MINIQSAIEVFAEEYEKLSQIERNILQKGLKEKDLDIAENPTTHSLLKKILKWEVEQMAKEKEKAEKKDLVPTELEPIRITKEDIKKYFCANATDSELALGLRIAEHENLDPFKNEIYFIKRKDKFTVQTGYTVYLKRAERSQRWNGFNVKVEGEGMNMKAIITIWRKDWEHPFVHEAKFKEFCQYKGDGTLNYFWRKQGEFQIKKVVISQGVRLAFSTECGGLPYTRVELGMLPDGEEGKEVIVQTKVPAIPKIEVEIPKETPRDKRKKIMADIKAKCKEVGKDYKKITGEIKKELAISGKALDSPEPIFESFRSRVWSEVLKNKK